MYLQIKESILNMAGFEEKIYNMEYLFRSVLFDKQHVGRIQN